MGSRHAYLSKFKAACILAGPATIMQPDSSRCLIPKIPEFRPAKLIMHNRKSQKLQYTRSTCWDGNAWRKRK